MTDGDEIYQTEILGLSESVNEKLARGLKPLLKLGSTITKKTGEDALVDLSDKFDELDNEDSDNIASHLNMAIELMQDGYSGDATKKLKQFNKACKDVLNGKEISSAFESVDETLILPINELTFNDLNGNPSKISKEIANIIQKALPSKVLKNISELEPNYNETMASPHDASKKGVGTGFVEYKGIGVIMKDPKPDKLSGFTVGIRKRTSGPGTGYIAIKGSIKKKNSLDHQIPIGDYKNNYSVATEFWVDGMAEEKLRELFDKYLAKYL